MKRNHLLKFVYKSDSKQWTRPIQAQQLTAHVSIGGGKARTLTLNMFIGMIDHEWLYAFHSILNGCIFFSSPTRITHSSFSRLQTTTANNKKVFEQVYSPVNNALLWVLCEKYRVFIICSISINAFDFFQWYPCALQM